ncbi:MAG: class I ribonucleotide reductase maintenance protein YfaE [Arsenophonus sp.]|nr:MAG: class I ribonucleotide reductase maintenance protein YfaE [Arsenophonus sp.]
MKTTIQPYYSIILKKKNIKSINFYIKNKIFLLKFLKKNNIYIESQCQSGYCGCCHVKLQYGKVKYIKNPIGLVNDYDILPCICFPITDIIISINYYKKKKIILNF